ncbi:alpha/beta fold hydrolase [Conexibacter sp. SYSU D00693]|uniref:alpha/beta fold hydrolase n=1 Tax=Conexibacter sp. SYSU D00693 TaxID=2812560 RepID=UPI00196B3DDD|nr:alpha/beta hydrolase [Conexibacter sp. SYSU D00693]
MAEVREEHGEVGGEPARWFSAEGDPARPPVLYVHGVPTSGRLWTPFLERTGGLAPDLAGFGRSTKRADHPYDVPFLAGWLERFLEARGVDRVRLVVQDWGAGVGLAWAQEHPERVERLVVMDAVPLLPGYRWHRIARAWRTPVLGELSMGLLGGPVLGLVTRESNATRGPMPRAFLDLVKEGLDQGTQRAILRLYRSAPPDELARLGERLGALRCPALVLWGAQDPYIPSHFCEAYANALGGPVEHEVLDGAGHWPWYDRPELVDRVAQFLV